MKQLNNTVTITEHRQDLTLYLYEGMRRFEEAGRHLLANFLFNEASRLEQTGPLLNQRKDFSTTSRYFSQVMRCAENNIAKEMNRRRRAKKNKKRQVAAMRKRKKLVKSISPPCRLTMAACSW